MSKKSKHNIVRRYDIDSIRVIALFLLIFYHIAVAFQPWASDFLFIENTDGLLKYWFLMEMLNIWRIPILFVVSGMGVFFAIKKRNLIQMYMDRSLRILIPLIFGSFFIYPICVYLFSNYYEKEFLYYPFPGHLWFLVNIFLYAILIFPIFNYIKNKQKFIAFISKITNYPFGLIILFSVPMMIQAFIVNPEYYASFAFTPHGLFVGLICFILGYLLVSTNQNFWINAEKLRFVYLGLGISMYFFRILNYDSEIIEISQQVSNILAAFEASNWILSIFGFGTKYLNKSSKILNFFSKSVYPIYIIHFPVQFFLSSIIFPININAEIKFLLLLISTFAMCIFIYQIIKHIIWFRLFFGMKK